MTILRDFNPLQDPFTATVGFSEIMWIFVHLRVEELIAHFCLVYRSY